MGSSIECVVQGALASGGDLAAAIGQLGRSEISSEGEARAIAELITAWARGEKPEDPKAVASVLHGATALFQQVKTEAAAELLRELALPSLRRIYDARLAEWTSRGPTQGWDRLGNDLLFVLKIFAMYGGDLQVERIVAAARLPLMPGGFLWSVVLGSLGTRDDAVRVVEGICDPLPSDFIGVALLDKANELARAGKLRAHPFDTELGLERMRGWFAKPGEHDSYCVSAAAAIPFIRPAARPVLLELGDAHPNLDVQMEAAWARARLGDERGVQRLVAWARDPRTSARAAAFLKELGKESAIPAQDADFKAMATMCSWLAHPNEFGRPPDEIALFDHRRLQWPPTGDRRPVWLFRYRYVKADDGVDGGIGMVGSTTFALFGESTASMSPEDVYALHCSWELRMKRDPRAPTKERSIAEGRRLLGFSDPERS